MEFFNTKDPEFLFAECTVKSYNSPIEKYYFKDGDEYIVLTAKATPVYGAVYRGSDKYDVVLDIDSFDPETLVLPDEMFATGNTKVKIMKSEDVYYNKSEYCDALYSRGFDNVDKRTKFEFASDIVAVSKDAILKSKNFDHYTFPQLKRFCNKDFIEKVSNNKANKKHLVAVEARANAEKLYQISLEKDKLAATTKSTEPDAIEDETI